MSMTIARYNILNRILSCPMIGQFKWKEKYDVGVEVGDLVSISSAPASEWYLSWVVEIEEGGKTTFPRYVLKSIETGNVCGWANVGVNVYDREEVKQFPEWKWTDKQYAFKNRWNRVCYKWNDAYLVRPNQPIFEDDNSVILSVRGAIGFEYKNKKTFPNWKKCTMKEKTMKYLLIALRLIPVLAVTPLIIIFAILQGMGPINKEPGAEGSRNMMMSISDKYFAAWGWAFTGDYDPAGF